MTPAQTETPGGPAARPKVRILVPALMPCDAVGTDAVGMLEALTGAGYEVEIFAETIHRDCARLARPLAAAAKSCWQSPGDLLIYHHATGWPVGQRILFAARNRIAVRYHNITPPAFFSSWSPTHMRACEAGMECTRHIAGMRGVTLIGASSFNCGELIALGADPQACRVLAPLHGAEELGRAPFDMRTLERYAGDAVNILFVGAVKPNKGHAGAIRILAAYQQQFNYRSRLIFAGGIEDCFHGYVEQMRRLAAGLGLAGSVVFTGRLDSSQIKTLYATADVFLCTSEHEGFCVPLVEAMYFRLPIVAWARTAVPETVADCGYLVRDWDESTFASGIAALAAGSSTAREFGRLGRRRYQEVFSPARLEARLVEIVDEIIRPRATARPVVRSA
jgi:glycosyltransferase involved in cell wall biosynthesis